MSQKRNNSQGQLIFQSSLTCCSSYIIQHWYNGLDSEGMRGIKSDNLNQLNIHRALHPNPVLTYHIYLAGKKASNWSLLMVLCLENFLPSLHIWKRTLLALKWVHKNRTVEKSMEETQAEPGHYFKHLEAKVSVWKMGKNSQESWWISCWCLRADYVKLSDGVNEILS